MVPNTKDAFGQTLWVCTIALVFSRLHGASLSLRESGSLNIIGPHELMESGTVRKYGFVGGSVTVGLGLIYAQVMLSEIVHFLLSSNQDVASTSCACMLLCSLP